jgi:H+/Cl- antiporter ClcA
MVSKDQGIGALILIVCAVIAIAFVVVLAYPKAIVGSNGDDQSAARFWLIAIPVAVAFIAIMAIGAWIGWTMATTPPPKPIEEITSEMEEKKEEPKTETMEEAKASEPAAEEKAPEKKKKGSQ